MKTLSITRTELANKNPNVLKSNLTIIELFYVGVNISLNVTLFS